MKLKSIKAIIDRIGGAVAFSDAWTIPLSTVSKWTMAPGRKHARNVNRIMLKIFTAFPNENALDEHIAGMADWNSDTKGASK